MTLQMIKIIKLMQEKVEVCQNSMRKNFFKSCRKLKVYFLLSKSVVYPLHLDVRWNDVADQAAQLKYE